MKKLLRVFFVLEFTLCFLALSVSGTSESKSEPDPDLDQNSSQVLQVLSNYFTNMENKNREQEKVIEKLQEQFKSLQEKSSEDISALSKQFEDLRSEISSDHGVWLLTPCLRGPRGKKGEKGDSGSIPAQEESSKNEKGESGQVETATASSAQPQTTKSPALPQESITSCNVAMEILPSPRSKIQRIYPFGNPSGNLRNTTSLEVLCDFETNGGGWTLIQKRSSGPREDFNRVWSEYANGFGSVTENGNFWLGLENIHALTKNGDQELRIELEDFEGNKVYAKYSSFSISDASDFYRLSISGFSGNSNDSLLIAGYSNNGSRFSTKDKDNGGGSNNCAADVEPGGWWFPSGCSYSQLKGFYREKGEFFTISPRTCLVPLETTILLPGQDRDEDPEEKIPVKNRKHQELFQPMSSSWVKHYRLLFQFPESRI